MPPVKKNDTKRLNWNTISNVKVENTLFAKEEFQESAKLDDDIEKELLDQFSSRPPPKRQASADEDVAAASGTGPKTAGFLEPQRMTNILIMLSKFSCPPDEIVRHVNSLDPLGAKLSDDNISALSANSLKDEELEMARNYVAPAEVVAALNAAEAYAYHVARLPRFSTKVKAMWCMRTAGAIEAEIRESIMQIVLASREVRRSKKFEVVLATVLGIGNFLNAGTAKGQARGFRLETLPKLCDTKTRGGDLTLLHYIVQVVGKKAPAALTFYKDIPHVATAKRVSKDDIAKELATFQRGVALLGSEVTALTQEAEAAGLPVLVSHKMATPPPPSLGGRPSSAVPEPPPRTSGGGAAASIDSGAQVGGDGSAGSALGAPAQSPLDAARVAYSKSEAAANDLQQLQEEMHREFADAATYLGEDIRTAKTDEVFEMLSKFVTAFVGCVKDNEKKAEEEERQERLAKRQASEEAARVERRKSEEGKGGSKQGDARGDSESGPSPSGSANGSDVRDETACPRAPDPPPKLPASPGLELADSSSSADGGDAVGAIDGDVVDGGSDSEGLAAAGGRRDPVYGIDS